MLIPHTNKKPLNLKIPSIGIFVSVILWFIGTVYVFSIAVNAISYIRLRRSWLYLVAGSDWFSRYVVSWELDQTLEMPFVVTTVERALTQSSPTIWNSDQGSHFTSPQYTQLLLQAGVQISMDGKGRASDNIFTERLWRTIKYEEVYLKDYAHPKEALCSLAAYFDFYDHRRRHQALDYRTPASVYRAPPAAATAGQGQATGAPM